MTQASFPNFIGTWLSASTRLTLSWWRTDDADEMYWRFDDVFAQLEDIKTEQVAQRLQLDRHERWHHKTAEHIGLRLSRDA